MLLSEILPQTSKNVIWIYPPYSLDYATLNWQYTMLWVLAQQLAKILAIETQRILLSCFGFHRTHFIIYMQRFNQKDLYL